MTHTYTQTELQQAMNEGRDIIVGYRDSGSLHWCHGTREIIVTPHPRKVSGLPFTKRGRRQLVTAELFNKLLNC